MAGAWAGEAVEHRVSDDNEETSASSQRPQLLRKPFLLEYEEFEKLRHNAATDSLTGLKNRRMFEEHLGREINRSKIGRAHV